MKHDFAVNARITIEEDHDHVADIVATHDQNHDQEVKEDVLNVVVITTTLKTAQDHHHKQQNINVVTADRKDTEIMLNHTTKTNHAKKSRPSPPENTRARTGRELCVAYNK